MSQQVRKYYISTLLALALGVSTSSAFAQPPGGRGGPPPEAIDACADLSDRDACTFEGRRGDSVTGVCFTPPREEELACRPEGGPPNERGRS